MFRKVLLKEAVVAMMLILAVSISSCSKIDEAKKALDDSKTAGVEVEDGWTIKDNGEFMYVAVVENTTDKTITKGNIHLVGLDEEGNVLNDPDVDPGINTMGTIFPGEKAMYMICSANNGEDGNSLWSRTPATFRCEVSEIVWGETDQPHITIENAERIMTNGDSYYYKLTLKNNSEEDFDWQQLRDNYGDLEINEVLKDVDGKIIGMTILWPDEYEQSGSYPVIPAGGEITTEAYVGEFVELPLSEAESREVMITWR